MFNVGWARGVFEGLVESGREFIIVLVLVRKRWSVGDCISLIGMLK